MDSYFDNMTVISKNNISFLTDETRTPQEMIDFMKQGAVFRSFASMLEQLRPGLDAAAVLTDGLTEITGEPRSSVQKKVRNWLNGKNLPKSRETIFQICFILGLTEPEANQMLGRLSDTGIHYRNPDELSYAYALRRGLPYEEALRLKALAADQCRQAERNAPGQLPDVYTKQVRQAFGDVETEEEFVQFFAEHGAELGTLHRTAYRKFIEMLDELQSPLSYAGAEGEDRDYTLAEVMQEYMQMGVPVQQRKGGVSKNTAPAKSLGVYQKLIRKYWPSESTLIRMRGQKEDVSRKTLLLLYLATEAFDEEGPEDDFDFYEDLEEDPDTLLEIRIEKMNLFLEDYGMNLLDPGHPFDLLILYAMRTEEDEDARSRMEEVLKLLYEESGDSPES